MSSPEPVVLESVAHVAPFGLGLWDVTAGRLVSDGLGMRVFPLAGTRVLPPVFAQPNRSGVFVAHGLPGLRAFEAGSGDEQFWAALPPPRPFLVEVRDAYGRFTPFVLQLGLPAPRGLVLPSCAIDLWPLAAMPSSPPVASPYVPLFATPARPVPAGMTAVRAVLIDNGTRAAAAFAVLEVRESGRLLARGIADERGQVAAVFAYPEASTPLALASPPVPAQPHSKQTWTLDIAVRYRRDVKRYAPDPTRTPLPDLCEVLAQPAAATVTTASPIAVLSEATLHFGEELVLGADAGAQLLVSPA